MENQWNDRNDRIRQDPMLFSMNQMHMSPHPPINIGYGYPPPRMTHLPIGNPYSLNNRSHQSMMPGAVMPNLNSHLPNLNVHCFQLNKSNNKKPNSQFDSNYKNDGNGSDSDEDEESESDPDAKLFLNKSKQSPHPTVPSMINRAHTPKQPKIEDSPTQVKKSATKEENSIKKEASVKEEKKAKDFKLKKEEVDSEDQCEFATTDNEYANNFNNLQSDKRRNVKNESTSNSSLRTGSLLDPKPYRARSVDCKSNIKNDEGHSSDLDDVSVSDDELSTSNLMVGQYIEIKNHKKWYRWELADIILHVDNTDYIMKSVLAEISN